jgi:hypothetical protein
LDDTTLFIYFLFFMSLWVALMVIWTVIPEQRPYLATDILPILARNGTITQINTTPRCEFGTYNYVALIAMILTLAFGVWMTYSVRNTPSAFNESKWIAFALYNWVVIGVVLNAISNFAVTDPDIIFIMEALTAIITQTGVVGLLFVPKIIEIMAGRGNNNETFQSGGSGGSGPSSHSNSDTNSVDTKKIEELTGQVKAQSTEIEKLRKELQEARASNAKEMKGNT